MVLTIDELMDNAFVLTIDDTRLRKFMERWDTYGLDRPRVFRGFSMEKGTYRKSNLHIGDRRVVGSISHHAMVKMAECMNLPFIFILEDDALPCDNIKFKLELVLHNIPDNIDVLRLGIHTYESKLMNLDLPEITTLNSIIGDRYIWGSHAYIVFNSYYRKYEEIFNNYSMGSDDTLLNYTREVHGSENRIFTVIPTLFIQKNPSPSYRQLSGQCIIDRMLTVARKNHTDFNT